MHNHPTHFVTPVEVQLGCGKQWKVVFLSLFDMKVNSKEKRPCLCAFHSCMKGKTEAKQQLLCVSFFTSSLVIHFVGFASLPRPETNWPRKPGPEPNSQGVVADRFPPHRPCKPKSVVCDDAELLVLHLRGKPEPAGPQPDHTCEPL